MFIESAKTWGGIMTQYISSIIHRYGDMPNTQGDAVILRDILNRQGTIFLTDVIADHIGLMAIKNNLGIDESKYLLDKIVGDLKGATYERI
jgi:hypothetical protein